MPQETKLTKLCDSTYAGLLHGLLGTKSLLQREQYLCRVLAAYLSSFL